MSQSSGTPRKQHPYLPNSQDIELVSDDVPRGGFRSVLFDFDGIEAHRVLTDADGRFMARADHPGPHRIRIDRIGYESLVTDRFDVPVSGTVYDVLVPIQPVELVGIDVSASRRCEVRPEQAREGLLEDIVGLLDAVTDTPHVPVQIGSHAVVPAPELIRAHRIRVPDRCLRAAPAPG